MKQVVLLGLLLWVWLVAVGSAAGQVPDVEGVVPDVVGTVDSTVSDVVDTAEETAGQATGAGGSSSSGGVVGSTGGSTGVVGTTGVVGSGGGTSSSGSDGGSASARSRSSEGGRAGSQSRMRSRFDRLPRRLERLLERIELGQNVRANLRRLEHALASASPELRRRVLRLIRAEIARLRRDGVTPAERRRIDRLRFVAETLAANDGARRGADGTSPAPSASAAGSPAFVGGGSAAGVGPSGETGPTAGKSAGVLGTQVGGGTGEDEGGQFPGLGIPGRPDDIPFGVGLALLALLALGLVGVVAGVTSRILGRVRSG